MLKRYLMTGMLATSIAATPALADEGPILGHELFGSGPEKVIVLHDWMGDSENYKYVRPWLDSTGFSYAFVDVRGYGRSKGLKGEYSTGEVAADTAKLADHLGWAKYHLVGHSMNGMAGFKALSATPLASNRNHHRTTYLFGVSQHSGQHQTSGGKPHNSQNPKRSCNRDH